MRFQTERLGEIAAVVKEAVAADEIHHPRVHLGIGLGWADEQDLGEGLARLAQRLRHKDRPDQGQRERVHVALSLILSLWVIPDLIATLTLLSYRRASFAPSVAPW
jgi:hypothetical protein